MKVKCVKSFSGLISMGVGEVRDIPVGIANDLLDAKYVVSQTEKEEKVTKRGKKAEV